MSSSEIDSLKNQQGVENQLYQMEKIPLAPAGTNITYPAVIAMLNSGKREPLEVQEGVSLGRPFDFLSCSVTTRGKLGGHCHA